MPKLNFTWRKKEARYQTGESCCLNKISVGGYGYNASRSQSDTTAYNTWVGQVNLPSLKETTVYGTTEDEIKTKIELKVTLWFREAIIMDSMAAADKSKE